MVVKEKELVQLYDPTYAIKGIEAEIELDGFALSDLELIGIGGFSPLTGFLNEEDYQSVVDSMRLVNGAPWSIPITLPVDQQKAELLKNHTKAKLVYKGDVYGVITIETIYQPDKKREAKHVYQTEDTEHPGVAKLFSRPSVYVGGDIVLIKRLEREQFGSYYLDPAETREQFAEKVGKPLLVFKHAIRFTVLMNTYKKQR